MISSSSFWMFPLDISSIDAPFGVMIGASVNSTSGASMDETLGASVDSTSGASMDETLGASVDSTSSASMDWTSKVFGVLPSSSESDDVIIIWYLNKLVHKLEGTPCVISSMPRGFVVSDLVASSFYWSFLKDFDFYLEEVSSMPRGFVVSDLVASSFYWYKAWPDVCPRYHDIPPQSPVHVPKKDRQLGCQCTNSHQVGTIDNRVDHNE
jgi:hypothetical protein